MWNIIIHHPSEGFSMAFFDWASQVPVFRCHLWGWQKSPMSDVRKVPSAIGKTSKVMPQFWWTDWTVDKDPSWPINIGWSMVMVNGYHHSPQDLAALEHQRGIPSLPENGIPFFGGLWFQVGLKGYPEIGAWNRLFVFLFVSGSWMRKTSRQGRCMFLFSQIIIYCFIYILPFMAQDDI